MDHIILIPLCVCPKFDNHLVTNVFFIILNNDIKSFMLASRHLSPQHCQAQCCHLEKVKNFLMKCKKEYCAA